MNYALVANNLVVNIIVGPMPIGMIGVALGERPVMIGDTFSGGVFLRDGEEVLTPEERLEAQEEEPPEQPEP